MGMTEKPLKQLYFKYLVAAFGSALVGAIYTLVDMAVIGQYAGPTGTAAITLVLPVWSFICSLGILTGIGGSVLYIRPALFGADSLWFAMPVAEISVAIVTALLMRHFTEKLVA